MLRKSPSRNLDQFILRLPEGMRERIMEVAKANNRSMNAEIVARLDQSFLPSLADRLHFLMDEVNLSRLFGRLNPSKIAELIGEADAALMEAAFSGKCILPFEKLDSIAKLWGANAEWLKHGIGAPFPVGYRHNFTTNDAYDFLQSAAKRIMFVRATNSDGSLAIVIERGDGRYDVASTPMHISENIGAGGENSNAHLANACRFIWKKEKARAIGYLVDIETYYDLVGGKKYPGALLRSHPVSYWNEEWWDEEQFMQSDKDIYWPGYKSFCVRIYRSIELTKYMKKERDDIISGKWSKNGYHAD